MALSPLNQYRWKVFKKNKRSIWSLRLFLVLFGVSLMADFIANDKPLLINYDQHYYFPIFKNYPETIFGGDLEITADYRDSYIKKNIEEKGWMLWPPIPYNYDTVNYHLDMPVPSPPTIANWLGTDDQGRDVLARLIYGFRLSVLFGLILTVISGTFGVLIGGIQGYFGGKLDLITQRIIEIWMSLPLLYMIIILTSFIKASFWWLLIILVFFKWTSLVFVVRAEFLKARNLEYVKAAQALGVPRRIILWSHMLPNAMVAALTILPFVLNAAITTLTSLDFLGFGLPPGSASLGELLSQGRNNIHAPWLGVSGFVALALLMSLLTFIGEGIRDAFDSRKIRKM